MIPNRTTNPGAPTAGQIWYDSDDFVMRYYNGTTVETLSIGGGDPTKLPLTGGTMAGADGGALTGPALHAGAVPSDGGTLVGIPSAQPGIPPPDGGVLSSVAGSQPVIPPGDGGAAFVDPGGVCFTPLHTTAATGAPPPITLMPPPDPMQ